MKITWELILAVSGGMVVLYNATNALLKFVSPLKKIKDKVDNHEQRLIKDYNRINEIEKLRIKLWWKRKKAKNDHIFLLFFLFIW